MIPKIENFIKNKNVEVIEDCDIGELGLTAFDKSKFTVKYNSKLIEEYLKDSWLGNSIEIEDFQTAILLHEYCHVMYTDFFEVNLYTSNDIVKTIINILEDSRIEYQFSKKYPTLSLYFDICLGVIRQTVDNKTLNSVGVQGDKIKEKIDDIYNIVRFNRCSKPIGEFESLVFCLNRIARRGTTQDVSNVSILLYNLICKELNIDPNFSIPKGVSVTTNNTQDIIDALNKMISIGDDADAGKGAGSSNSNPSKNRGNNNKQNINSKNIVSALQQQKDLQKQKDSENKIYNYVVGNYSNVIYDIRQIFKRVLAKRILSPAFDGEISLSKQQELFLSEKLGEEGKYYKVNKVAKEGADVIICRDISGSTCGMSTEYAQIICIILAALEQLKGMRSCVIDFNCTANIVKTFEQKAIESGIKAISEGGTSADLALELIKKEIIFKNKKRLCIVVSDGEYNSRSKFDTIKKELEIIQNVKFLEILISNKNGIKLQDLPKKIYEFIIKELKYDLPA